ncbi:unnamed protein product [Amoebophrya sp. A120]|nr:unnamed protein product [Amoebophrya sp. A120]|eukprot:GSA120T00003010001.1
MTDDQFGRLLRYKLEQSLDDSHVAQLVRDAGHFETLFDRLLRLDCADYYRFLSLYLGKNIFASTDTTQAETVGAQQQKKVSSQNSPGNNDAKVLEKTSPAGLVARGTTAVLETKESSAASEQEPVASKTPSMKTVPMKRKKAESQNGTTSKGQQGQLLIDTQEQNFAGMPKLATDAEVSWLHSETGRDFLRIVRNRIVDRERSPKWDAVLEILRAEGMLPASESDDAEDEEKSKSPPLKRQKATGVVVGTLPASSSTGPIRRGTQEHMNEFPTKLALIVCADERQRQQTDCVVKNGTEAAFEESFAFLNLKHDAVLRRGLAAGKNTNLPTATTPKAQARADLMQKQKLPAVEDNKKNNVICVTADQLESKLYQTHPDLAIVLVPDVRVLRLLEVYSASVKELRASGAIGEHREAVFERAKKAATGGKTKAKAKPALDASALPSALFGVVEPVAPSSGGGVRVDGNKETGQTTDAGNNDEALDDDPSKGDIKCFLLSYQDSPELVKYEQSLAKETKAVETAVFQKKHLIVDLSTSTREGLARRPILQIEDLEEQQQSTRLGGAKHQREKQPSQIIVDVRELNARLPFFLYQRHVLRGATIKIGDYILSRDVCVERKSVYPDLIQSLQSGRLLQQIENMTQAYKTPILLLEFGPSVSRKFPQWAHLTNTGGLKGKQLVRQKLLLLLMHFPRLRVIWSPSYAFTARIFAALKKNRMEPTLPPDAAAAETEPQGTAAMGLRVVGGVISKSSNGASFARTGAQAIPDNSSVASAVLSESRVANPVALDVLRRLPGVTGENLVSIAQKLPKIAALGKMSRSELCKLMQVKMDSETANRLWRILHSSSSGTPNATASDSQ